MWRGADLRQDAGQVPLGIDAVAFATGDQRPEPGVVLGSRIVPGEQPIFLADRHPLQRPFAGVLDCGLPRKSKVAVSADKALPPSIQHSALLYIYTQLPTAIQTTSRKSSKELQVL